MMKDSRTRVLSWAVMRRCLLALSALLSVLAVALPHAWADPPTANQVRQMLSGYETVPGRAAWRALGPETLPVLVSLYQDTSQPAFVRMRAVGATGYFPSTATRTFLLAVTHARGQSDLFVREAVIALGRAFGAQAVTDLVPFLSSRAVVVRDAAARALGGIGTATARQALQRRLVVEPDPTVRATLQRSMR